MSDNPVTRWIGHEIKINGICWRVVEVTPRGSVRYERVYDNATTPPPILRDPEPLSPPGDVC